MIPAMTLTRSPTCSAWTPGQTPKRNDRVTKALKHLEARRVSRAKTLAATLAQTLQRADLEARQLFVNDVQDFAAAASEALLPPEQLQKSDEEGSS